LKGYCSYLAKGKLLSGEKKVPLKINPLEKVGKPSNFSCERRVEHRGRTGNSSHKAYLKGVGNPPYCTWEKGEAFRQKKQSYNSALADPEKIHEKKVNMPRAVITGI